MAGHLKVDAGSGRFRQISGLMVQQQDWFFCIHALQQIRQRFALTIAEPCPVPLFAARHYKPVFYIHEGIPQNGNAAFTEQVHRRFRLAADILMVSQHREHAEARLKSLKRRRHVFRDKRPDILVDDIASQQHQVRTPGIDGVHQFRQAAVADNFSEMNIGHQDNFQFAQITGRLVHRDVVLPPDRMPGIPDSKSQDRRNQSHRHSADQRRRSA